MTGNILKHVKCVVVFCFLLSHYSAQVYIKAFHATGRAAPSCTASGICNSENTHKRPRTSNQLSHIRKKRTRCLFIKGKGGKSKKKQEDKINRIAAILYSYWCTILK